MTHRRHLPLGGCADALKGCDKRRSNPPHGVATALRAVIEEGLERFNALTEVCYKNLFQFSFVCLRRCH
jgi:hypothetical protein